MVSVFLYLLYFRNYDVINDVIMSDADCTPVIVVDKLVVRLNDSALVSVNKVTVR